MPECHRKLFLAPIAGAKEIRLSPPSLTEPPPPTHLGVTLTRRRLHLHSYSVVVLISKTAKTSICTKSGASADSRKCKCAKKCAKPQFSCKKCAKLKGVFIEKGPFFFHGKGASHPQIPRRHCRPLSSGRPRRPGIFSKNPTRLPPPLKPPPQEKAFSSRRGLFFTVKGPASQGEDGWGGGVSGDGGGRVGFLLKIPGLLGVSQKRGADSVCGEFGGARPLYREKKAPFR